MKFRTLSKWDDPAASHALVFCAQLLEEMLFDFTPDTYKPSVLHTGLLCLEASEVISDIDQGIIREPNLWHVLAELCKNIESDPVAKSLLPLSVSSLFPVLKVKDGPVTRVRPVIDLLRVNLSPIKYRAKIEQMLHKELTTSRRYQEIRRLARAYVTHIIAYGYHPQFIRECVHQFFWYGKNRISNENAIGDFFSLFPTDQSKFDVLFKVDSELEFVGTLFSTIGVSFSRTLPAEFDVSKFPDFNNSRGENVFALIGDVEAKDVFSARERAESRLRVVATIHTIYHHRSSLKWSGYCLVKERRTGACRKINESRSAMQKREDPKPMTRYVRLKGLVEGFSLEKDSFEKFHRSAQLHSMALASDSLENQILNVWIALESLVPSETRGDSSSTIEHISSSLSNFLNVVYIDRLLGNLAKDLLLWNSWLVRKILKKVKGRRLEDKLIRLLALNDYESCRDELEVATKDFYLLRDRLEYFKSALSSPASVAAALKTHAQRLEWQIRRIYRARNIVVHSGRTPRYTRALIEHAHDYLDTILVTLVELASNPKTIHSVPQGFKFVELRYREYLANLEQKGQCFDESNIENLAFGLRRAGN